MDFLLGWWIVELQFCQAQLKLGAEKDRLVACTTLEKSPYLLPLVHDDVKRVLLANGNRDLRKRLLALFCRDESNLAAATQMCVELLGDKDSVICDAAFDKLVANGRKSLPELVKGFTNKNKGIRTDCLIIFGRICENKAYRVDADTVERLCECLFDESEAVRVGASAAFVDLDSRDSIGALKKLCRSFEIDKDVRSNIAHALGKIGSPAVPFLSTMLKSKDENVVLFSIVALGEMGADAKALVPEIRRFVDSEWEYVAIAAKDAIRMIQK